MLRDDEDKRVTVSLTIGVEVYAETEADAYERVSAFLYKEAFIEGCFLMDSESKEAMLEQDREKERERCAAERRRDMEREGMA